ncbi:GNAT family N-acetyltransferase [Kiritimatiellaeota bacterium B1221]|nr:GNAT family N-acetyltransferase [Kiritimatiellaeota bacterium B1221]
MSKIHKPMVKEEGVVEIRFLEPEDALSLMQLRHRAIRECDIYFGTPRRVELARRMPYYRRQLLRYRMQGRAALIGAWQGEQLLGMTGIRIRNHRGALVGLIYSTFIEQAFRGQGFGKLLVEEGVRQIQALWQIEHFLMQVEVHNLKALKLYQNCGFEITERQELAFWIDGVGHDVFVLEASAGTPGK